MRAGEYRLPWDMSTPGHRQRNPVYMARKAVEYFQEATGVLGRRERGKPEDVWLDSDMVRVTDGCETGCDMWLTTCGGHGQR